MAQTLKPFRAAYYNPARIKNVTSVVCPPYDVISRQELKALRKRSPYNFSRILLADNYQYEKNRRTLDRWCRQRIFISDAKESIYLYEQRFRVKGKAFERFGVIGLLNMNKKDIFPHERTHKAPKEDRKRIIRAVEANLSPIFVICPRRLSSLARLHVRYQRRKPFLECRDGDGNRNRLWKIQDRQDIAGICREAERARLVIADGHHRFEISFDYFKKHRSKFKDLNYLLAYITDCQKGLVILPTHRVIDVPDGEKLFFQRLDRFFFGCEVTRRQLGKRVAAGRRFGFGVYRKGRYYFLELKNPRILDRIPNKLYRRLDSYVFHRLVLPLFKTNGSIEYTHSVSEAVDLAGRKKTAFILRPAALGSVVEISSKGFRLPQKSTYFYPKLLSGLIIRRFGA
jgi:uncharacterized protein (DUF1015 family)